MGRKAGNSLESCHVAGFEFVSILMDPFVAARLRTMIACYMAYWDTVPCEVLAVEHAFQLPLVHPVTRETSSKWKLAGKMDVLIRMDRRVKILEHKTTSDEMKPGGSYRQRLRMDGQISQYILGAESLGYSHVDVIYDVLLKPRQAPLQATPMDKRIRVKKGPRSGLLRSGQREQDETPEEYEARLVRVISEQPERYLVRITAVRSDKALRAYQFDIWQVAEMIQRAEETKIAPRNPDSCWRFNTPCPYLAVCNGEASITDPTKFRDATGEHEELEGFEAEEGTDGA